MKYAENKSFCEDLTEGKFSFPIIHAIRSDPGDPTLLSEYESNLKLIYVVIYIILYYTDIPIP